MKSLSFRPGKAGGLAMDILPLRMPQAFGVIDPEPFRVRSVEGPALLEPFSISAGMRTLHVAQTRQCALFESDAPLLTFIISGEIVARTGAGKTVMEPGDLFLVTQGVTIDSLFETRGDCRLIQLVVAQDWPGERARAPLAGTATARGDMAHNFKRMYKGVDDRSYFRDFDTLFGRAETWSAVTPLIGFRFIGMAQDTFIDWHPEIVNNFVIVLSGALELETGGGSGGVEIFRPGDVCLAEDRTGEGHIDRVHGHVQVAVLIIADEHLWP